MGYQVYITQADDWASNEGYFIEPSEWINLIERDESLRLAEDNGPYFALWEGDPNEPDAWLDLVDGNITTKNPSESMLRKMLEIADLLDARVQGDDGEVYDGTATTLQTRNPSRWSRFSFLSFILSLVSLTMLFVVIPLDSFIRKDYPVGAPMPVMWAATLAAPSIIGILSWLTSSVFAISAFLLRQPSLPYAAAALAINVTSGTCLVAMK